MKAVVLSLFILCSVFLSACGTEQPVTPSVPTHDVTLPTEPIETAIVDTPALSLEQENALKSAKSYLRYTGFSRSGLIEQLLYEGYSQDTSEWAVDTLDADWAEEAVESAKSYIKYSGFSYVGLVDQLIYEGFTDEQASYGVDNCEADWNAEALETAESYLKYSSFSKAGLADQLDYEGFTAEQIEFALVGVGY